MATESTVPFPLKKTNYLSKDYLTLRDELLARLPVVTDGKWSNINESDPGIAMMETFISGIDNLMFYLDMQGQEMDLDRARQRTNVIKLLRLIGYETRGVAASTGTVTVQVSANDNPIYPVVIKSGTQLSAQGASGPVIFTTQETVTLTGASDSKTIPVVQGQSISDNFLSDGTPSQKFVLSNVNVDKFTVGVFVDDDPSDSTGAVPWTLVDNFFSSDLNSQVYKVQIDEFSRVFVTFGDGQFGAIPGLNSTITMSYIQTLGADGNVGKNAITRVSSGIPFVQDAKGNKVSLTVLNSQATAGGADVETIEQAKSTALGLLFGLNRAMSRGDYETLMTSVPGVTKAIAWGENEEQNPDYRLLTRVRACFFSKELADMHYNPASRSSYRNLRDNQVATLLQKKMPITTRLVFVDPQFVDVFVSLSLGIDTVNYDPNVVIDQVRFNILDYFSIDNVNFGQDIRISTIMALANAISGVKWSKVTRLHTTPANAIPDSAPNPPLDLVFEKWKIPTFADSPTAIQAVTQNVTPPYIQGNTPVSFAVGQNDVKIVNPDDQSDILTAAYFYIPSSNIQHITINYSSITDEPAPQGGYYGNPNPVADYTTTSSLE